MIFTYTGGNTSVIWAFPGILGFKILCLFSFKWPELYITEKLLSRIFCRFSSTCVRLDTVARVRLLFPSMLLESNLVRSSCKDSFQPLMTQGVMLGKLKHPQLWQPARVVLGPTPDLNVESESAFNQTFSWFGYVCVGRLWEAVNDEKWLQICCLPV